MGNASKVRQWLAANPGASNAELYAAFPAVPSPSLRRIAGATPAVRRARDLPGDAPKYKAPPIMPPDDGEESFRYGNRQIKVTREFNFRHIHIPLSNSVVSALRDTFEHAKDVAKKAGLKVYQCVYLLECQAARSGKIVGGEIRFDWGKRDFFRVGSGIVIGSLDDLWQQFEQSTLEHLNDTGVDRAKKRATMKSKFVSFKGSDPLGMRPKKLTIYMHSEESDEFKALSNMSPEEAKKEATSQRNARRRARYQSRKGAAKSK